MNRSQIMARAWELIRAREYGYRSMSEALRDAWAEAKGQLSILPLVEPVKKQRKRDVVKWLAKESLRELGRVAG